jgi:hypothetical protein
MVRLNIFHNLLKDNSDNKWDENNEKDIFSNIKYICTSSTLITESLAKGSDVLQHANGDISITQTKTFTYRYFWDEKKGKFVRASENSRRKKNKYSIDYKEKELLGME